MKKFSELTGLSSHTLRYYEKIGLLKNIGRNSNGHRVYTSKDIDWVSFIVRLKETGMPLESILEYALLREAGPETVQSRQELLEAHKETIKKHIDSQLSHLSALENKIQLYKEKKVS
ncbi:MerR family transcriptional regulator [Marinomonas epiphytica]